MTQSNLHNTAGLAACPPHPDHQVGVPSGTTSCQRWTLTVVCLVSGLLLLNVNAPNVALTSIARDLAAGFAEQQWVLSSYALALAALLLAGGALGDRFGHRRLFMIGLAVFTVASVGCALAPSALLLVVGRIVQGVGAAALFPSGLALLGSEFAGAARARAIGIWGASTAAAIALGPLLGGVLVEAAGWRSQFVVWAVLAVAAMAIGARQLRETGRRGDARLDWLGTALLTVAMALLVVLVQRANAIGWTHPLTIGMAVAAVAGFVAFLVVEFRVPAPLISPALMRNPTFVASTAVALVFAAAGFAPLVYITMFLLQVAGSGPIVAGLQIVPFALAALVVSLVAARIVALTGVRTALAGGLALCGIGVAAMLAVAPDSAGLRLLPGLILFGAGAGIVNPTMTVVALGSVSPEHGGMASGVNNTARQLGIAMGIAALGAILQGRLASGVADELVASGVPAPGAARAGVLAAAGQVSDAATSLGTAGSLLRAVYDSAFVASLQLVFAVAIGIVVLGIVIVVVLVGSGRRPRATATPEVPSNSS